MWLFKLLFHHEGKGHPTKVSKGQVCSLWIPTPGLVWRHGNICDVVEEAKFHTHNSVLISMKPSRSLKPILTFTPQNSMQKTTEANVLIILKPSQPPQSNTNTSEGTRMQVLNYKSCIYSSRNCNINPLYTSFWNPHNLAQNWSFVTC